MQALVEIITDCFMVVPGALEVISSPDEDSSDSLSDPVAKKRDIAYGSRQSEMIQIRHPRHQVNDRHVNIYHLKLLTHRVQEQ